MSSSFSLFLLLIAPASYRAPFRLSSQVRDKKMGSRLKAPRKNGRVDALRNTTSRQIPDYAVGLTVLVILPKCIQVAEIDILGGAKLGCIR